MHALLVCRIRAGSICFNICGNSNSNSNSNSNGNR